jgi:hypothetical protein
MVTLAVVPVMAMHQGTPGVDPAIYMWSVHIQESTEAVDAAIQSVILPQIMDDTTVWRASKAFPYVFTDLFNAGRPGGFSEAHVT